jgi:DNA polymerase III alpha subunit
MRKSVFYLNMDIDIDFPSTFNPTCIFKQAIPASMIKNRQLVKHPCGYYFQNMPVDEYTELAAIPYEEATALGFFKVDCLTLHVLDNFKTKTEIRNLLKKEPDWKLLQDPNHVAKLSQVKNNALLLQDLKPSSAQELADAIAIIRPGKRYLLERYKRDKEGNREELYAPRPDVYCYKQLF